jgi:hypothetical protein
MMDHLNADDLSQVNRRIFVAHTLTTSRKLQAGMYSVDSNATQYAVIMSMSAPLSRSGVTFLVQVDERQMPSGYIMWSKAT